MSYEKTWELAQAVMTAVVDEYTLAAAAEPSCDTIGLPELQYISNGDVPGDCELLAVALNRVYGVSLTQGHPNEEVAAQMCTHWRAAAYEIVLLRCGPIMDDSANVDFALVQESGRQVMRDSQIITRGVLRAYRADAFGVGPTLAFEDWASIVSEGGLVGGRLVVRIGLV